MDWEFDDLASTTYPLYSRAVVGDLCPDPVTPLTATAGVGAQIGPAWARFYAETGLRPAGPGDGASPVAMFGAYLYLNTSLFRLFGVYAAGADPMAFARQYLGERPDVPRQRDERPALGTTAERLHRWTTAVLSGSERAEPPGGPRTVAPDAPGTAADPATLGDGALAEHIRCLGDELRAALYRHARAELATAVASDLLTRTAEEAGHPGRTGELAAGLGGAVTEPVLQLWRLAARVGESGPLTRLFDQAGTDPDPAAGQLAAVTRLLPGVAELLENHGHLGGREWELSSDTWGTEPRLLLALLDAVRRAGSAPDPATRVRERAGAAGRAATTIRRSLGPTPLARERFDAALAALTRWLPARQAARQAVSAVHHRQRLAARELGRRHVGSGLLDEPDQIFMLLAAELAEFAAEPARFGEPLRMRAYDYHALRTYRPPFVTLGQPPPVVRWPRLSPAGAAGRRVPTGTAAAAGASGRPVRGPARVLRAPCSAAQARPGDVLVLPTAGPEWVPLVGLAAAVVVDDGAALSDTAVACRDLGVPCVVSAVALTGRVPSHALAEVDGSAGTVRLSGRGAPEAGERDDAAEPFGQPERHATTHPA